MTDEEVQILEDAGIDPSQGSNLIAWRREVANRVERNMDVVILVDGEEGSGKSTLGFRLCRIFDPDGFDHRRVGWGVKQYVKVALDTPPGGAILMDEAVEGMQAREAMTRENKAGQKWVQVCRERNLITVICYPSLWDLDIYLREHRIKYRVYVAAQGRFEIYRRESYAWQREAYWRKIARGTFDHLDEDDEFKLMQERKHEYVERVGQSIVDA